MRFECTVSRCKRVSVPIKEWYTAMLELKNQAEGLDYQLAKQMTQRTKLVITDVDGTLTSFWDYFVPAVRDFLKEISVRLDLPVTELAEDIGRIIQRRGTHEYP